MSTAPTLGRNDPCHCGSGRKYKKCCADADAAARRGHASRGRGVGALLTSRREPTVRPGRQTPLRSVPASIPRPSYIATDGEPQERPDATPKTPEQIERMRAAGRTAREILLSLGEHIRPGVTTDELDAIAHERIVAAGAYPSPLGYQGYPKSICTSVNEVICHGIPDDRPLAEGDIMNIDITIFLDGVHGDTSTMFGVGQIDPEAQRLCDVTRAALGVGIAAVAPGGSIRDVGAAIQPFVESHGFSVVRAFVGHGIGEEFHSGPVVHHYDFPDTDDPLVPGMTFTIEPMVNAGTWRHRMWDDGWTAVTGDLRPSAQHEHTVLVTDDGVEILTLADGEAPPPTTV